VRHGRDDDVIGGKRARSRRRHPSWPARSTRIAHQDPVPGAAPRVRGRRCPSTSS